LEVIEAFINASSRPVYSIEPRLSPSTNLGLYHRFNSAGGAPFDFNQKIAEYLDSLLQLYLDDELTDGHEQHFLFNRLIAFSKQYVSYAMSRPISEINPEILIRLNLLQSTFPGKLVTLEALFKKYEFDSQQHQSNRVDQVSQREVLVQLAAQAEAEIPYYATLQSLAVFYELVGRVHALSPDNVELSIAYYRRSIEAWPVNANTSICPLTQIYLDGPNKKAYDKLVYRFPDYSCE
jgi:hypothetical protein